MEQAEIVSRIKKVIELVFQVQDPVLTRETTAIEIDGWNSLTHVLFLTQVEKEFGIAFSEQELFTFKNLGEMMDRVAVLTAQ